MSARAPLDDVVRVRYVRLAGLTAGVLDAWEAALSAPERERAARLRVDSARREFVAAKGLLRTALSRHTGVAPEAWGFAAEESGKPYVLEPHDHAAWRFSLSHTRGLVVCAFAEDRAVGVDAESFGRAEIDVDELAARFFTPVEAAALATLGAADRRRRFFQLWTLKESYVKARGLRLTDVLGHASFTIAPEGAITAAFDATLADRPQTWSFTLHDVGEGHVVAVTAHRRAGDAVRVEARDALLPRDAPAS